VIKEALLRLRRAVEFIFAIFRDRIGNALCPLHK
jgi:hypothetical protein